MRSFFYFILLAKQFLLFPLLGYCNDIVINEIMANPKDGKLPLYEYIELFNNGDKTINLSELSLQVNNQTTVLSIFLLAPKQYVILCSEEGANALNSFGNQLSIPKWTTLNNTGASIRLMRAGSIIDEVTYKDSWHSSSSKKAGGWSLERINPDLRCGISSNWISSTANKGGTPGSPNSTYNKNAIPSIEFLAAQMSQNKIRVKLNIDKIFLPELEASYFQLDDDKSIASDLEWNDSQDSILLTFEKPLLKDRIYTLISKPLLICGKSIVIPHFIIFEQSSIYYNSIVINEILFNPKTGGSDFVEIYNQSEISINLQNWKLGNRLISTKHLLLEPKEYYAFTTEKDKLILHYANTKSDRVIEVESLPAYPNQQGVVTLYSPSRLIDSVYYNADMHSSWIKNQKGISLERESYEKESNLKGNFRSASTMEAGATPGYKNSSNVDNFSEENLFQLSSSTFSPDGDSFEDELEIIYKLKSNNNMINFNIYNEKGVLIKRLQNNESIGTTGKIHWDGLDEKGQQAAAGHYIYWAEIYNENGGRQVFKSAFVLVRKSLPY